MRTLETGGVAVFLTRNGSLREWINQGLFDRETALYRRLREREVGVTLVTYGGPEDARIGAGALPGIRVCCNRWRLKPHWYRWLIPYLHVRAYRRADLIKTNQMIGAEFALRAARFWRKPLIARCGYLWSKNAILEYGENSPQARESLKTESEVFEFAERIVVTTRAIRDAVAERFPHRAERIRVIPNYVDTDLFCPASATNETARQDRPPRLCFVGRLSAEKNLENLFAAVEGMDLDLDIVGHGPLRERLAQRAASNPRIRLAGSLPNNELPAILRGAAAFVFPSLYEGHPKAPIEAMACGLPVIANDVPGLNDLITHGETGWLCGSDAASIRAALERVLPDEGLRRRLSENARRYALDHFSLDRVVDLEISVYREIVEARAADRTGRRRELAT